MYPGWWYQGSTREQYYRGTQPLGPCTAIQAIKNLIIKSGQARLGAGLSLGTGLSLGAGLSLRISVIKESGQA